MVKKIKTKKGYGQIISFRLHTQASIYYQKIPCNNAKKLQLHIDAAAAKTQPSNRLIARRSNVHQLLFSCPNDLHSRGMCRTMVSTGTTADTLRMLYLWQLFSIFFFQNNGPCWTMQYTIRAFHTFRQDQALFRMIAGFSDP